MILRSAVDLLIPGNFGVQEFFNMKNSYTVFIMLSTVLMSEMTTK